MEAAVIKKRYSMKNDQIEEVVDKKRKDRKIKWYVKNKVYGGQRYLAEDLFNLTHFEKTYKITDWSVVMWYMTII